MGDEQELGHKRLHVFKAHLGAMDWRAREEYRWAKHQDHTLYFHRHGIVPDHEGELLVRQRKRGEMAIEVRPGYGIDYKGHDVILRNAKIIEISRDEYFLPCTIYIVLRYQQKVVEQQRMKDGSRKSRYFGELAEIELLTEEPAPHEVELARIRLSEDAYKITDARNADRPRENEIDLRFRRYCAVYKSLDPTLKRELIEAIETRRQAYLRIGGNKLLRPAAAMSHCLSTLRMMVEGDMLNRESARKLLEALGLLDTNLARLIEDESQDPWVNERPEFEGIKKNAGVVRSLLDGPRHYQKENMDSVISFLSKGSDSMPGVADVYGDESLVFYEGQEPVLAREYPLSDDWERIKVWSAEFPEKLYIDGMEWTRVGELNITDEASEKKYKFEIHNAIDAWRTRQRLYYPDGTMVDDTGVAHEGGYAEYEVRRIIPDTHLAVIRMMDYARADFELEFVVNDQLVGVSQCLGHDRRARWRNWPFVIPAWFVNDDVVRIKQMMTTAERDVNMFRYWFYQPVDF